MLVAIGEKWSIEGAVGEFDLLATRFTLPVSSWMKRPDSSVESSLSSEASRDSVEFKPAVGSMKMGTWEVGGVTSSETSSEVLVEASEVDTVTIG